MTLQASSELRDAIEVGPSGTGSSSELGGAEIVKEIESVLIDAALDVGALIDAVCCRCGDWVDWRCYRPHPGARENNLTGVGLIIRLMLAENDGGLRDGGYVEMCILPERESVEANGGYYDGYRQPQEVIEGSVRWQEVNHRTVGQALLLMYDRIMREYMGRADSAENRLTGLAGRAEEPAASEYATNGGRNLTAVRAT